MVDTAAAQKYKKKIRTATRKPAHHAHTLCTSFSKHVQIKVIRRSMQMILPQVHLRKPCYDFSFL